MTLDEAIMENDELAENFERRAECYKEITLKHCRKSKQLASWLRELKERREAEKLSGDGEYIEKQKAYNVIHEHGGCDAADEWSKGYDEGITTALEVISRLPAADVQPIVHCKDCKYRKEHHYEVKGEAPYVKYSCKFTTYSMSGEGFCSFGARMDGGDDYENS